MSNRLQVEQSYSDEEANEYDVGDDAIDENEENLAPKKALMMPLGFFRNLYNKPPMPSALRGE
jgi:hypothetical protein